MPILCKILWQGNPPPLQALTLAPLASARAVVFGISPLVLHMRPRGLGYTAGVKGAGELVPFGASP